MKKLFNHTKRPDRNWEEDVQDGYDWDEEQDGEEQEKADESFHGGLRQFSRYVYQKL